MNTIENQKEIVQYGVSISQFNIDNPETCYGMSSELSP